VKRLVTIILVLLLVMTCCGCFFSLTALKVMPEERLREFLPGIGYIETAISESKPTGTQLPPTQATQSKEALPNPTESPAKEVTPTPIIRSRVVFYQASDNVKFTELVSAAAVEGIEITMVSTRESFLTEIVKPDVVLVIYPSDSWNNIEEDLREISFFVEDGGRALLLYNSLWARQSSVFEEYFGVSILKERVINTGGRFYLEFTLPDFLENLKVYVEGTAWILGNAYLETDLQDGKENYLEGRFSGEERLVFFSSPDKSVTFLLAVVANDLGSSEFSYTFFDDNAIEYGDNETAALLLLNYLIEGGQN